MNNDAQKPTGKILDFNNALREKELETYLSSNEGPDRDKVLAGLNSNVEAFVAWLYPSAIITPKKARVGNIHGSPGSSLVIETHGGNKGLWADFADPSQKGGNLIDLFLAARGQQFSKETLNELAEWVGHGTRPEINYQREQAVKKLKKVDRDLGPQKGEWHYTDAKGVIIASVYRFEPEGGGKEFLPWDADKRAYGNPDVRPLYNLPSVLKSPSVVVCEGEKAAEALITKGIVATCVMGGSNSPLDRTDLEPLRGRNITIWPDNDEPGRKFAAAFAQAAEGIASEVRMLPDFGDKPDGWDAADCDDPTIYLTDTVIPSEATPTLPFFWFNDAEASLEANDFVEGLLTSSAMSVVYGPSNCGKTFFVIDLALHVAWGHQWRSRDIDKGAVVYLSLEGAQGVRNRIAAFRKHHKVKDLPFIAMPQPVDLLASEADVSAVIQLVQYTAAKSGIPVRMVIIDTLSRAMAGGDESSSKDMTALIANCDRIRSSTDAHICIVHHSGKDEARGARGHSSLRAATDTEIEIKRDPEMTLSTVKVTKQRDLEAADPFCFTLQSMVLGTNRRGKDVTSCVVMEAENTLVIGREKNALSPKEIDALRCLEEVIHHRGEEQVSSETGAIFCDVSVNDWKMRLEATETINRDNRDTGRKQMSRLRNSLVSKGYIQERGGRAWLTETSET